MKYINKKFWKNKKILITGHSGFKGYWLCNYLKILGCQIYGISHKKNKKFNYRNIIKKEFIFNIKNQQKLKLTINNIQPDIVFHFAAQSLVSEGYKNPTETYLSNLIGTSNLLQLCADNNKIKSILIITSDKCYKMRNKLYSFNEYDELSGNDPYSASKACQEIITWSFAKSFFHNNKKFNIASCRAGNIIGGGDFSLNRLLPDIIMSIYKKQKLLIRNPSFLRPWQHVLEPLTGYIILAQNLSKNSKKYSQAFNFGPNKSSIVSVKVILNIFREFHKSLKWRIVKPNIFKESKYLSLNISKSKKYLNFKPNLNLFKSLKLTYEWYDSFFVKKIYHSKITQEQIQNYLNNFYEN